MNNAPATPTLSVIIPAYNSAATIQPCLESIRASQFKNFELIIVNDGSQDDTPALAKPFADHLINNEKNIGKIKTRLLGAKQAKGDICVFVDSDVLIKPQTLTIIYDFFSSNPTVDAVTGLLSKSHPNRNFFSQYKNLYMHFIFEKLPKKITFLYGSIFSTRKGVFQESTIPLRHTEDTGLGQQLSANGKSIEFCRSLEVEHLKKYTLGSWVRNDFHVPFEWAHIFLRFKGWKQFGRRGTGFAHSPKEQLASVILAPGIFLFSVMAGISEPLIYVLPPLIFAWLVLNCRFFSFLKRERGWGFGLISVFATFLDHLIMATGILSGFLSYPLRKRH